MFTGIIETVGKVTHIERLDDQAMLRLGISSEISKELHIDQSVSHNGVCLTVVDIEGDVHYTDVVAETLHRSNLGDVISGSPVNLERASVIGDRLDGHMVQGHVDARGTFDREEEGYWTFVYSKEFDHLVVEKGSICINGVSLTVADLGSGSVTVAIIPYTLEHTNFGSLKSGDAVNLEFDILGKYVQKQIQHYFQANDRK